MSDSLKPCPPPDFRPRAPRLHMPPLACDCHAHILGPLAQHAYSPERVYTPPDCLLPDYRHMLSALGVARAVLVQPSVYGSDNTVMLRALREAGADGMGIRGVAVVEADIGEAELASMHAAGVRGVRVNIVDVRDTTAGMPLAALRTLAARIAPLGWHMEFLLHVDAFANLDRDLADFPVEVVFGHLGYMRADKGIAAPGFQALLRLLEHGRAWVKLTGPYRISTGAMPYPDVTPLAAALLRAAPARIVWGSDWPHVMMKGDMPNDGDLADLLPDWITDGEQRRRVLVDNPAALYGF
jgi:predicted TIM-barrel fold metal-dependent hydrolase